MNIALQSSVFLPTPAPGAGAVEYLCAKLAEGLYGRGHNVTVACLEGSRVGDDLPDRADTFFGRVCAPEFPQSSAGREAILAKAIAAADVDVLFDHSLHHLTQRRKPELPVVTMSHGMAPVSPWSRNVVFTSRHHGRLHGRRNAHALHNGVDVEAIPFLNQWAAASDPPRLAWIGRVLPYKRPHLAAELAREAGVRLLMAGPIVDKGYYDTMLAPLLNDDVTFLGEVNHKGVIDIILGSSALLFTSDDQEPAGIVLLEAQAAGRPVLSFRHGASPEFMEGGRTGFLADSKDAMLRAIRERVWERLAPPAECRDWVRRHRSIEAMVTAADELLHRAMKGEAW